MARISHRPKLKLTTEEKEYLIKLSHSRSQPASLVTRAKIILLSFQGKNDTEISQELNVSYKTGRNRIQRVLDYEVKEGLKDKQGAGKPRTISDESRVWLIKVACTKPKDLGYPHELWTQRLLAKHIRKNCIKEGHPELSKISQGTISKILNISNIKPHKIRSYTAKVDPDFDTKAKNILEVYNEAKKLREQSKKKNELDRAILSCDEKAGIQAIGNKYPDLMPVEGKYPTIARDHEYIRHGTLSLFACMDLVSGKISHKVLTRKRSREFIEFLSIIESTHPVKEITMTLDNYKTHISEETRSYLDTIKGKFKFVFTPKHASWLNAIENFFSKITRNLLKTIRVESKDELRKRIDLYIDQLNEEPTKPSWKYRLEEKEKFPGGIII
ncbi:MAG: IS630 family transposase [Alphaproteobacteria bacterium]|nr:MAG: IS630 family transposase [Alphaproteobacteria bacterium]